MCALTSTTGAVVERYGYEPYGELTILAADGATVRASSSYANTYTYTGRRWDADLSLYYFRARYYDPKLGRFLGRDPLKRVNSGHTYSIVSLSPLCGIDASGLKELPVSKLPPIKFRYPDNDVTKACSTLWDQKIRTNRIAVSCWKKFLQFTSDLPKDQKKKCYTIGFVCECCGKTIDARDKMGRRPQCSTGGYYDGFTETHGIHAIHLCADTISARRLSEDRVATIACHELIHATQFWPCNKEGKARWGTESCLQHLQFEFEAYRCSGECTSNDKEWWVPCAANIAKWSKDLAPCHNLSTEEWNNIQSDFYQWAANRPAAPHECDVYVEPPKAKHRE